MLAAVSVPDQLRSAEIACNANACRPQTFGHMAGIVKKLLQSLVILVFAVSLQFPAHAQLIDPLNVEPDANGVDMIRAGVSRPVPVLSIPAAPNLRLERLQLTQPVLTGSESGNDPKTGSVQLNNGSGASESF